MPKMHPLPRRNKPGSRNIPEFMGRFVPPYLKFLTPYAMRQAATGDNGNRGHSRRHEIAVAIAKVALGKAFRRHKPPGKTANFGLLKTFPLPIPHHPRRNAHERPHTRVTAQPPHHALGEVEFVSNLLINVG